MKKFGKKIFLKKIKIFLKNFFLTAKLFIALKHCLLHERTMWKILASKSDATYSYEFFSEKLENFLKIFSLTAQLFIALKHWPWLEITMCKILALNSDATYTYDRLKCCFRICWGAGCMFIEHKYTWLQKSELLFCIWLFSVTVNVLEQ